MQPTLNKKYIYYDIARLLRDYGPCSRAAIAQQLRRSPATIGRVVENLCSYHVIREIEKTSNGNVGRPSRLLQFNSKRNSILSVDLRSTEAYAVLTDLSGNIISTSFKSLTQNDASRSIEELLGLMQRLLEVQGDILPAVIVIGAPSIVDREKGIIEWAPSLEWEDVPLKHILEEKFHISALIENDVNLAAVGEFWKGAGRNAAQNIAFISIGTGIGAGIILNGKLYQGSTHAAGEVAYFVTDVNVLRDNVGKLGNLESRVGHDGLIRMAQLVAQRYPASQLANLLSLNSNKIQPQDIIELAKIGDNAALVVYKELVDILTIVICNIAVLLDPEIIILGGLTTLSWSILIPAIMQRIGNSLLRPVHITASELGKNALIMGGCYSALELIPLYNH